MSASEEESIHPRGEEIFEFTTDGGKITIKPTDDVMTPYGGLVPFAAFVRHTGLIDRIATTSPIARTSPNAAPTKDIIVSFLLTALCEGKRFSHVERFREDPTMAQLFGINRVVSDDTIRRYFKLIDSVQSRQWIEQAITPLWRALPDEMILDWDSTVLTRYGHQEQAAVGYNPQKPGRRSHHPLLAVAAGTRMCVSYRLRPGNTVTATHWADSMEEVLESLKERKIWLNRGDIGLGHETTMAWHEKESSRPHFLFKLKMSRGVRQALAKVKKWEGPSQRHVTQVAQGWVQLHGWSQPRRVIFARKNLGFVPSAKSGMLWDELKYEFDAYVTNLPQSQVNEWQIVDLYRQRADVENVFDEIKNQWGFGGFCSRHGQTTELAARLMLLTYNLWNLFLRLMNPKKHIEAITGRKWFLLIAARLVKSSRQSTLQIAVRGTWWEELKDGYQRVCKWIQSTAPQLKLSEADDPDFSFLAPIQPLKSNFNCGI